MPIRTKPIGSMLVAILLVGCQMESLQTVAKSAQGQRDSNNPQSQSPGFQQPEGYTLQIQSSSLSILSGGSASLSVSNGTAPYTYALIRGAGTITAGGLFTADNVPGRVIIEVTDARGQKGQAAIGVSPNDAMFGMLFALNNGNDADIDGLEAWNVRTDCRSIRVGVIDTGADLTHPDLASNLAMNAGEIPNNNVDDDMNGFVDDTIGWNFVDNTNDPTDDNFHGTHVSGTIGALGGNGVGVIGICPRASIVPLKFLDMYGGGLLSDALLAFDYARLNNIKVLNNSWGGGGFVAQMFSSIQQLDMAGVLFFAAAGNDAEDNDQVDSFPADYDISNVVSVASTTNSDQLSNFSNFGATTVDIAAPGSSIQSTFPVTQTAGMADPAGDGSAAPFTTTSYFAISGTSMATPHVAGAAALVWAQTPAMTMLQVRDALLTNADTKATLNGRVVGSRRLNVMRALDPTHPRP